MPRRDLIAAFAISLVAAGAAVTGIGWDWALPAYVVFAVVTGPLAVIDLRQHRLPNVFTLPAIPIIFTLLALAALADSDLERLARAALGAIVLFSIFALLHLVNASGLGLGDVKLSGSMGLLLGWLSWTAVLWGTAAGFFAAAVVALGLLAARRATMKSALPFGPFMLLGAWLVILASALPSP